MFSLMSFPFKVFLLLVSFSYSDDSLIGNHFTEILMCFSVLKNIPRTLSVQKPKNAVHSINGIRVISISWIVLGHCYYFLQDINVGE